jgi:hypothetical protein
VTRAIEHSHARLGGPILRYTKIVMAIDITGLVIVALAPVLVPGSTAEYFAWTIAVPLTAAMIGAGYTAALPSILWALALHDWLRIRIMIVAGLALTSFILLFTLRDLSSFHLTEGPGTAIFVGWVWLVAYVCLPPLNIVALVLQERARTPGDDPPVQPVLPWTRIAFLVWAAALAVFGFLLLFAFSSLGDVWPWRLNRLAAGAMGQWLLTVAVAMGWAAREGDFARIRVLAPFFPLYFVLALVAVTRTSGDLIEGRGTVFVAVLAISAVVFGGLMWAEERRHRASTSGSIADPQPPRLEPA